MIGRIPGFQLMLVASSILATTPLASLATDSQLSLARPGVIRMDVTRDAWVSEVGQEADGNNGGAPRLKIKSIQEMTLIDIDARPLVGKTIQTAVLHLKKAGDEPIKRVTTSGVGAEWFEGTGSGYAIQPGGATFRHRRHPDLPWSIGGGDLTHVVLGNGGTIWRMADATPPDPDGWQHVPVDPRVVATRVAGLSHGFLIFDDTGSEWTRAGEKFTLRLFPNRFLYSREQNKASAPYFTVEPGPDDRQPPAAPRLRVQPETDRLPPGEALISWLTPLDQGPAGTLGFFATLDGRELPRELIPLAGEPGSKVEMHLRDLKTASGATVKLSVCPTRGSSFVEWCMRTQSYPSDLTDAQWRLIEPHLPVYPGGRPRTTDLRDVVNAILYILRSGCQWRYLPKDFPPKSTVWKYFDQWRHNGTFETIHDLLRRKVRAAEKPYSPRTTASVDSQSVDTTSGGEQRGRDNAKNVDGRKRHIVVDSMGLLMAVLVTAASIDDAKAAAELFARLDGQPMSHVKRMYADSKYHNFILYEWVGTNAAWELNIVQRPKDAVGWVLLPIRWTVERTFAWLGKCRRLSKDREKSVLSSETFVRLAMIHLMLNRLEPKNVEAPFEYRAAA